MFVVTVCSMNEIEYSNLNFKIDNLKCQTVNCCKRDVHSMSMSMSLFMNKMNNAV